MRCLSTIIALLLCGPAFGQASTAEPPFTLLLITADGGQGGFGASPSDAIVRQWVYQPQSAEMAAWRQRVTPKELAATSPIMAENHADVLRRIKGLPALALIESSSGAVWDCVSGPDLPASEMELAKRLDVYFAATANAAQQAAANAFTTIDRNAWDSQRQQRLRTAGGPPNQLPFNMPLTVPDQFDFNASAAVDAQTQAWGTKLIILIIGGALLVAFSFIASAWILAEAITDQKE